MPRSAIITVRAIEPDPTEVDLCLEAFLDFVADFTGHKPTAEDFVELVGV